MVFVWLPVSLIAAVVLTIVSPSTAHAQAQSAAIYSVDPAASVVGFTFYGSMLIKVKQDGRFRAFGGRVSYDPARPSNTHVDLTVDTTSVDMHNSEHDELIKSGDFFDVEHFPTMHFTSSSTATNADGTLSMTGDMTIRGVTKQLTIPVKLRHAPQDGESSGPVFETTFPIDRTEFGLNGRPDVAGFKVSISKKVQIHIAIATAPTVSPFLRGSHP